MVTLTRPEGPGPEDFVHSRRALGGLFFAGYALASVSAEAAPITTDQAGIVAEAIAIPSGGLAMPAYVARPEGRGRYGAVIVVSEVFGVHEYIRDVCRRLAKAGYVAIAPDFFFRAGDPAPLTDFKDIQKIVETATNEQVLNDVAATMGWLDDQAFVDRRRYAITGFCWGGAVVWMAAARYRNLKAGVAWYGRLAKPAAGAFLGGEERPWPIAVVRDLKAPVLGLYAGKDRGIPLSDVAAMKAAFETHRKPSDIVVFAEASHGFHADYRDAYDATAAQDGWNRMLAWFRDNRVAPGARR